MCLSKQANGVGSERKGIAPAVLATLAFVGIAGPVLFWALLLLAQSLYPGYDTWTTSISRLIFGPFGWLQTLNFYLLAVFTAAFGMAVYLSVAKSSIARIGSVLLILMGVAQLLTAVFRVDVNSSTPRSLAYTIHDSVFLVSAASFPIGALLLLPNLWTEKRWHPFAWVTITAAVTVLLLDLAWLFSRPFDPQLINAWFGGYERILFSIIFVWMMVISTRLLYLSRQR